ncbi:hypothetical protein SHI21_16120 [Bacteriovorax sp. PP10]|uniref:Outer membrane protein beta-barrel domain-containing protein n=1 Tax=Bacteriovorax antarcticus TaxID=3088717 RepID=A0ABU5VZF2_9BACT|nr:hypothetical protein [Bacteriovorax sp. PP10]MEA9357758.1 hypothetical protein [Bacteriovorax sp. PP10]
MKKLTKKMILPVLFTASMASANSAELILNSDSTFNPTHENRFSFMMGVNPSLTKSADMSNFTFSYGKKMENYWIDTNFAMNKGLFKKFSANNQTATGATDEQLEEQKNSLTTIGVGIGRETRYAQTLLPFNDIYELMAANITYNSYKEDFSGKSFSGPGLLAKFSVYKRFNDYFSAGAHFNYNLAVVKRAQENDTETNSQRSLTLGFLTMGIDLSFYL